MSVANAVVAWLLESPVHRLLSGSTDLVRYVGPRSGRTITLPTQYARHGDDLVILVGKSESKSWWRSFRSDRDLDVLVQGRWLAMTARAVVGSDEPDVAAPLVEAYLDRFPHAGRALGPDDGSRVERAVVVRCRPR